MEFSGQIFGNLLDIPKTFIKSSLIYMYRSIAIICLKLRSAEISSSSLKLESLLMKKTLKVWMLFIVRNNNLMSKLPSEPPLFPLKLTLSDI